MIVAMIALFVALSGASYAALARNSVGPKQLARNAVTPPKIKKKAVTRAKIRPNAVNSSRVQDGSLTGNDLADGSVALGDLASNSVDGTKVVDGSLGSGDVASGTFLGGGITVQRVDAEIPDTGVATGILATCPAGATIIGGGTSLQNSSSAEINLTVSRPFKTGNANNGLPESGEGFDSWRVVYVNPVGGDPATLGRSFAICAQTP